MYDLLIKNGYVIDGSGSPGYFTDVAVKDGKIEKLRKGINELADIVIDAAGLTVTPGFIDSHSHQDLVVEKFTASAPKLEQGITTEISGMCGFSCAPVSDEHAAEGLKAMQNLMREGSPSKNEHLKLFSQYMDHIATTPTGTSMAGYVGHNTIRIAVMGYENREPASAELEQIKAHAEDAMRAGALGVSLGLAYAPGIYSRIGEAVEICKVVARYGGSLSVHMRYEDHRLLESVEEILQIVRTTHIRTVISHHKASGASLCWGLPNKSLEMIERINNEGYDVFLDQYPYAASSTIMSCHLPQSLCSMGHKNLIKAMTGAKTRKELREAMLNGACPEEYFHGVMIGSSRSQPQFNGVMLLDAAAESGVDVCDLFFDLLRDDDMGTACINWRISEDDVKTIMRYPRTMVGTDGLVYPNCDNCHPRAVASFPRVLGHYVREKKILTLPDAIRKMTGMPSMLYGLTGKGLLRVGMDADITIFDAKTIIDKADFKQCFTRCAGLYYVIVAGNIVVKNAIHNGGLFGRVLRASSTI